MASAREINEFLKSRRDRLQPEQVGFGGGRGRRRVPGLRREEVALRAGVSVEYYTQVERGQVRGVSEDVLEAISQALLLDDLERAHLFDLARAIKQLPDRRHPTPNQVRPSVQRVLDAITGAVAFVRNRRSDFVSGNDLAYAFYSEALVTTDRPVSLARFVFLEPRARSFYRRWDRIAKATAGHLRTEAARDPYDRDLTDLIGELSTRSDEFRRLWATHDVTLYRSGIQYFHHPVVGDLDLAYESFDHLVDIGQTLTVYTAEPGSPSQVALDELARCSLRPAPAEPPPSAPREGTH